MLIKISPTCWLNPQDVSAVVADRKIHAERVNPPCDHYVAVLWESYEHFGFDLAILERARDFSCGDCF